MNEREFSSIQNVGLHAKQLPLSTFPMDECRPDAIESFLTPEQVNPKTHGITKHRTQRIATPITAPNITCTKPLQNTFIVTVFLLQNQNID